VYGEFYIRQQVRHMRIVFESRWLWAVVVVLLIQGAAYADDPAPAGEAAELQALLVELRELREAKYRLRQQWAEEQVAQDRDLAAAMADAETAERAAADAATELAAAREHLATLQAGGMTTNWDRLHAWLAALPLTAAAQAASNRILLDAAYLAGLPTDTGAPLPARVAQAMSNYESAMLRGHTMDVTRRSLAIPVDGATAEYECEVLRLGGAIEYYVTADEGRCGYRLADGVWRALPATDAAAVRQAIRVFRRETAPTLVTLPLPPATAGATP